MFADTLRQLNRRENYPTDDRIVKKGTLTLFVSSNKERSRLTMNSVAYRRWILSDFGAG